MIKIKNARPCAARRLPTLLLVAGLTSCGGNETVPELATTDRPLLLGFTCKSPGTGFGDVAAVPLPGVLPFIPLASLKTATNPVFPRDPVTGAPRLRSDLGAYVANPAAAVQLGKALFWDIQAGSDSKTACATCHFRAGSDLRTRNQLNPGANGLFDGASTNFQLAAIDYPFVGLLAGRNVDNATGSAGIRASKFKSITSAGVEQTTALSDPLFGTARQVTAVNAPSIVNAVHNHRSFFNGRAQAEFNGVNAWGNRDPAARVHAVLDAAGNVGSWSLSIPNASLASQALAPPLNTVEMAAAGRTFPDIAAKLLLLRPIGLQSVDPTDSVLGSLVTPGVKGLNTTYTAMIQKAFQPRWWNSAKTVKVGSKSYPLTQANFSMFWGLAIMLYEATLVSDDTPMDRYVASRPIDPATGLAAFDPSTGLPFPGDPTKLDPVVNRLAAEGITIPLAGGGARAATRDDILTGLGLFERPTPRAGAATVGLPPGTGAGCVFCHVGAETTSASVRNLTVGLEPGAEAFKAAGFDLRMERMFMGVRSAPQPAGPTPPPVPLGTDAITYDNASYAVTVQSIGNTSVAPRPVTVNTYDVGWYDVGVRPTAENLGIGGTDFAGLPLSWTQYYQATLANPAAVMVPGGGLGCVDASGNPVVPPSAPLGSPFAGEVMDPSTGLPMLSGGLSRAEASDAAGSFKTASLRNVELTGPYFHTGGKSTLRQVVEFYDEGGDFGNATLSPLIRPLGMTEDQAIGLVAFLVSLTDDRVLYERAPFDHPELPLPAGQTAAGADVMTTIPAVGAAGSASPAQRFLGLNPFQP